jgi:hypothetical protein
MNNELMAWDERFHFSLDTPGYMISNYGRVMSMPKVINRTSGRKQTIRQRIIGQQIGTNGYPTVTLRINGVKKCLVVHRLVAKCFVINDQRLPIINHIDGVKTNNYYKNLEWCTHTDNIVHAYKTGLRWVTKSQLAALSRR